MKIKTWFEELTIDQSNALCEALVEVDDLGIYWCVQDGATIIVEGELFDQRNNPPLSVGQLQHIVEES